MRSIFIIELACSGLTCKGFLLASLGTYVRTYSYVCNLSIAAIVNKASYLYSVEVVDTTYIASLQTDKQTSADLESQALTLSRE